MKSGREAAGAKRGCPMLGGTAAGNAAGPYCQRSQTEGRSSRSCGTDRGAAAAAQAAEIGTGTGTGLAAARELAVRRAEAGRQLRAVDC